VPQGHCQDTVPDIKWSLRGNWVTAAVAGSGRTVPLLGSQYSSSFSETEGMGADVMQKIT